MDRIEREQLPARCTFREWLRAQEDEDSILGDLARSVASDPRCPEGDSRAIERYLRARVRYGPRAWQRDEMARIDHARYEWRVATGREAPKCSWRRCTQSATVACTGSLSTTRYCTRHAWRVAGNCRSLGIPRSFTPWPPPPDDWERLEEERRHAEAGQIIAERSLGAGHPIVPFVTAAAVLSFDPTAEVHSRLPAAAYPEPPPGESADEWHTALESEAERICDDLAAEAAVFVEEHLQEIRRKAAKKRKKERP